MASAAGPRQQVDVQATSGAPDISDPHYWVPLHIRLCQTSTGAIVLDLKRNRYFGVGRREAHTLRLVEASPACMVIDSAQSPETLPRETVLRVADHLVKVGLLSNEPPTDMPVPAGKIDLNGALTSVGHEVGGATSINLKHFVHFMRACAWAKKAIRVRTLYSVALELSEAKARHAAAFDAQRAIDLASVFRRLRPFAFTARNQCLFHALALTRFLSCYEVFPTWVIGVRARPWAAHSWVQQNTLLLDANPEHVCEYSPILTV